MKSAKKILYFTIYYILYGSLATRYLVSNQIFFLVPDFLVLYLFFFTKFPVKKSVTSFIGSIIPLLMILFYIVGLLSAVLNQMTPMSMIWGVRMFVRYSLLFYLVYRYFNITDLKKCKKIIHRAFLLNFFFCVVEFLTGARGDLMGGIMTGNGDMAIFIVVSLLIIIADYYKKEISLTRMLLSLGMAFICAMWAEVKFLYFVIPLCFYGVYVLYKRFSVTHIIVLVLSFFLLVPGLKFILSFYYGDTYVNDAFDQEKIEAYTSEASYGFTKRSFNRGTCIEMTTTLYLKDMPHLLFGYGIGSASNSQYFSTDLLRSLRGTNYYYFTSSYVLLEVGWVGYILFVLGHAVLLLRFFSFYRKAKDKEMKYWCTIGILLTSITFLFMWYNSLPYSQWYLAYAMWAICFVAIRELKQQQLLLKQRQQQALYNNQRTLPA